jgi:uncharacterized protein (DUF433 family)/DNA-binding transcriptional MerR regulator
MRVGRLVNTEVVTSSRLNILAAGDGCYEAARASALAGVPRSTLYLWARNGLVTPSVSPVQEKLWSYRDLLVLRAVSWLRRAKSEVPPSPMSQIRQALSLAADLGVDPWAERASGILVDRTGEVFLRADDRVLNMRGQPTVIGHETLDLLNPFGGADGLHGPHLVTPRPHLRIAPATLSGEPHVAHTRIATRTLAALAQDGYTPAQIARMYEILPGEVEEALDLERALAA